MDNNRKDIGRAIRNKLEGMQQQPSAAGWDKLRAELDSGKKKRGIQNWLWSLALLIVAFTMGLAYFVWPTSTPDRRAGQNGAPVESSVNRTDNRGNETNGAGSETNTGTKSTASSMDTIVGNSSYTLTDADNNSDNPDSESNTAAEKSRNAVNTTLGRAVSSSGIRNLEDANSATAKTAHNDAYGISTKSSTANGSAAPGRVSVSKKDSQRGSITAAGGATHALAHGSDKNGASAAKKLITQVNKSNKQQTGAAGKTANNTPAQYGVTIANNSGRKPLAKPERNSTDKNDTIPGKGSGETTNNYGQANTDNKRYSIDTSTKTPETNSADESSMLIASAATIIFTATLEGYTTASVGQATDSTAHELDEKIDNGVPGDDVDKSDGNTFADKRFYAFPYAAPNWFLHNSRHSLIDGRLNGLKTNTKKNLSYGVFAGYEATPHWGIRAGVMISRAEHTTNGVVADSLGGQNYQGIKYIPGLNNNMLGHLFKEQPFSIMQKTELFEVPVEVTYCVGGNKWGGKLIGGISVVHMRNDNVFVQGGGYNFALGSLKHTKQTSFTAGLGAGLYYEVVPNLQLNVEPFVKYYFNTFDSGSPLNLSIRVGLQYNFNLWKKKK